MPRFVTTGYGDRAGYGRTDPAIRDTAHQHDERLRGEGALMGIVHQPVQVRNHDGQGVDTKAGPFLRSDLPIAGFAVIEVSTLEEAVSHHSSRRRRAGARHPQYEPSFVRARRLDLAPIAPA